MERDSLTPIPVGTLSIKKLFNHLTSVLKAIYFSDYDNQGLDLNLRQSNSHITQLK